MKIGEIRKILGISNSWIADKMGYKNLKSYNNSAGKKKIEKLIIEVYKKTKHSKGGNL